MSLEWFITVIKKVSQITIHLRKMPMSFYSLYVDV